MGPGGSEPGIHLTAESKLTLFKKSKSRTKVRRFIASSALKKKKKKKKKKYLR
eukprot:NODE_2336_length_1145_cov_134.246350_g1942_i0.p5 GENE.NODE_2336_length_1145_cov_134.246350_g1942_i0~~NODE_2336_length_1145_cov_134.246350_g1942_i0.p5  ORF type:complete len:53 (-),score=7.88 NODE_2336_length_1145_cov_134.246350_g1942_i0:4-162(-)